MVKKRDTSFLGLSPRIGNVTRLVAMINKMWDMRPATQKDVVTELVQGKYNKMVKLYDGEVKRTPGFPKNKEALCDFAKTINKREVS